MGKKRILIVSDRFFPRNSPRSFRATELAKELVRQGHKVVVLIPFKGYDFTAFAKETQLELKDLGPLRFKSIKEKGNVLEMFVRRGIRRIMQLLFEYPEIELMFNVSRRLKQERGYDLLISIAVPFPIHWGAAKARTKDHRIADVWIADCGDPYMGDISDSFRKLFYFKYIEKWFCKKADYITIPFDGAKQAYYKEFHNKIRIIPQGFHFESLNIPEYKKIFDYPVFAYTGTFALGQCDPRPLLKFLATCDRKFNLLYTLPIQIFFCHLRMFCMKSLKSGNTFHLRSTYNFFPVWIFLLPTNIPKLSVRASLLFIQFPEGLF